MWILTVRGPTTDVREFVLPAGRFAVGRRPGSDIVLADESASHEHAEFDLDPATHSLLVRDLGTANGTFVNHERITQSKTLASDDQIRIGQHLIRVTHRATVDLDAAMGVALIQPLTRDVLLKSFEQHAVLLLEVSERLNYATTLSSIFEAVSQLMRTALGAEMCHVIQAEQFDRLAEWDIPTVLAQRAIAERSVVAIPNVKTRPDLGLGDGGRLSTISSAICVPVLVGHEVAALVYAYKTSRTDRLLSQEDVHLAVAISHLASLAIQRARMPERAGAGAERATTDSLTQVYHRHYFFELGEQEVQRARRFVRPLSAIVADVDHFKQVNDAHGHAVGDEILRAVAARCRLAVRQADLVGRYSGDKFAILVLENDLGVAHAVAERLRKQVASSPIYTERGLVHVTISLGLATLNANTSNLSMLLNEADAALGMAKQRGRDRVEVARSGPPEAL
jgi:diguanylate cyclase (GGDEF)-like protein